MSRLVYVGKRYIAKDVGDVNYLPCFADSEFDGDGQPNYIDVVGCRVE